MSENITKIKVGDDVRCISLDSLVIDSHTIARDGTQPLKLGTGLTRGDNDKMLSLSLGSGLEFGYSNKDIRLKLDDNQSLLVTPDGGALKFNLEKLYELLEARYNLTKK